MFRDRTNLFISYRQSYLHHPVSNQFGSDLQDVPLMENEMLNMDTLPPSWMELSDKVDGILVDVRQKLGELAPLHKKNALPGFNDRSQQEREIESLTLHITKSFHRCQNIILKFDDVSKREADKDARLLANNIKIGLATKVQDVSTLFRQMQSSYLRELRKDAIIEGPSVPLGSSQLDQDIAMSQSTLEQSQALLQESSTTDAELLQREHEITKIAQGILEVSTIFKDLQTMVIDQGTLLDRIDYNVEVMNTAVQGATKELSRGAAHQKQTQKCKIILLLSLIVVGLFLILIFKPRHH